MYVNSAVIDQKNWRYDSKLQNKYHIFEYILYNITFSDAVSAKLFITIRRFWRSESKSVFF